MDPGGQAGQGEAAPGVGHGSPVGIEDRHGGSWQGLLGRPVEGDAPDFAEPLGVGGGGEQEGGYEETGRHEGPVQ